MYRTIPDNLSRYSILKQLEHDSPFLQWRPHKMASFQRIQYGKRETKHRFSVAKTVTFYLRTLKFLSDFSSECPRFCQILPQSIPVSVRYYFRIPQFLSDFTSEHPSCLRFYLNLLGSVKIYFKIP